MWWPFKKQQEIKSENSEMVNKILELTQTCPDKWRATWTENQVDSFGLYINKIDPNSVSQQRDSLFLLSDGNVNLKIHGFKHGPNREPGAEPCFGILNLVVNSLEQQQLRQAFIKLGQEKALRGLERLELKEEKS